MGKAGASRTRAGGEIEHAAIDLDSVDPVRAPGK